MLKLRIPKKQQLRIGDDVVIVVESGTDGLGPTVCTDAPKSVNIEREARTIWPKRSRRAKGGGR
ncbi:MAG: carbon storage regulator [Planctomycetota bacterium]